MSVCQTKLPGFKGLGAVKDFKDFPIQQTQGVNALPHDDNCNMNRQKTKKYLQCQHDFTLLSWVTFWSLLETVISNSSVQKS